jgi:cytochrome c-type biogenesis protein CcmH/NrfG
LGRVTGKANPLQCTKAEELLLEGIKLLGELKIKPFQAEGHLYLGELYADTGQRDKALKALRKAKRMFQVIGMDYYLGMAQKALEKLEG